MEEGYGQRWAARNKKTKQKAILKSASFQIRLCDPRPGGGRGDPRPLPALLQVRRLLIQRQPRACRPGPVEPGEPPAGVRALDAQPRFPSDRG